MNYQKNINILLIEKIVEKDFLIKGLNKKNEITRLIYEILKREKISPEKFLESIEIKNYLEKYKGNFEILKEILIKRRYPLSYNNIKKDEIYLPKLNSKILERKYFLYGNYNPKRVFIEKNALKYPLTEKILLKLKIKKYELIESLKDFKRDKKKGISTLGKDELFLVEEKFDIIKKCPCTKNVICCGYYIFNLGFGCIYDCSYCYLQDYTNFFGIVLPVNIESILEKLKIKLNSIKIPQKRIGTGEFTDSLMLDYATQYSKYLIPFFENSENILELKTKSVNIENILEFMPSKNIVIAWSLNTEYIIKNEEYFTPSLKKRLEAAKEVSKKGFDVAFHFDPVIFYPNWEKDYKETIEMMFDYVKNIRWISIGTFRFHRKLKTIIEMRFPESEILNGELLLSSVDKKMRYPENIRINIYKKMLEWIKKYNNKVLVYFCMEPAYIWEKTDLNKNFLFV